MTSESLANGVILTLGGALAWALWRAAKPTPLFLVRIVEGRPLVVAGTVTPAFLQRVREVAAAHAIDQGAIAGVAHGALIRLEFSGELAESSRQQLRNWWATFGWAPPSADWNGHTADHRGR